MNIFSLFKKNESKPQTESKPIIPPKKMVSVLMQDGSRQEYPQGFIILDGVNCVVCQGKFYHTSLDCENLIWEMQNCDSELKGMDVKEAKKQKITYCANCSREIYLLRKGDSE